MHPMEDDGHFDATVASTYDRRHGNTDPGRIAATADTLAALAEGGPALEMGIGTGRIALPLAGRGIPVAGIEMSRAMVAALRAKQGGDAIPVTIGDMATTRVPGSFSLVFVVFNTIDNLTSQDAQVACFANAADHLAPGGRFVVETAVPPLHRLAGGETLLAFDRSEDHWGIDTFDVATQRYTSSHVWFDGSAADRLTVPFRYAWPSEMDLMARLAGLAPEHRWSDWDRAPFTRTSTAHVSVWRKPGR